MREPVVLSWSGGKDSAMALHALRGDPRYEVVALLTCIAEEYRRISHHGVREELLELQARSIGLPLDRVYLPSDAGVPCSNQRFEELMRATLLRYCDAGVMCVAHGDLFLEDLRAYREANLARLGMRGVFPLWKRDTAQLLRSFIDAGFNAYLCCVEGKLGARFAGRAIDAALLADLPPDVDPCGENGEYHSFVYDGPIFREPLDVVVGEIVCRDTRFYADLLPAHVRGAQPASADAARAERGRAAEVEGANASRGARANSARRAP
ncbi:MAG TPA: ATP-binding protein [Myxococcota bacterium]|nr:ATP-binding protein [Myxococcota bacterium]